MSVALRHGWAAVFHPAVVCAPVEPFDHGGATDIHRGQDCTPASHTSRLAAIDGVAVSDLLSRLRADNRNAFATIYQALHRPLWRLGVILTRSAETSEEIVQEVFLSLWSQRATLPSDLDIRAYLYAAVRNQARSRGRHTLVRERTGAQLAYDQSMVGQDTVLPDQAAETGEFHEAYQRALTVLTERERIALQLRVEEELTFDEIGTLLGVSRMGAHKIVVRAVGKIGQLLAAYRP